MTKLSLWVHGGSCNVVEYMFVVLNGELFLHIDETKYVVERWRMDYNHYRSHSRLIYITPAGFAELSRQAGCVRLYTPVLD